MLAIAVLFGLAVWVLITIIAILIGAKTAGVKGAFFGFMLTMGAFIVYWIVEYIYIQYTVTRLCETEGGVTVYVTPEQWRKQIGEEEWEKSFYTGEPDTNYPEDSLMQFKNKEYHVFGQINQRVIVYYANDYGKHNDIFYQDMFFYDVESQQILYHERVFSAGAPLLSNSLGAFKFWLDYSIKDCNYDKSQFLTMEQYSSPKH